MRVCQVCSESPARSSVEEPLLQQERFDDVLDSVFFFANCSSKRVKTDRPAAELVNNCLQQQPIHLVKALLIDFQANQGLVCHLLAN